MTTSTLKQLSDRYTDQILAAARPYLKQKQGSVSKYHHMSRKIESHMPKAARRLMKLHHQAGRMLDGQRLPWKR